MAIADLTAQLQRSGLGRWFYGREVSEQRILVALGAVVVVALLWVTVWKPVADWRSISVNRQQNAQQLHDWIKINEKQARQAARTNPSRQNTSITPVITRAAGAHEITVNRLTNEANGVVSVALQQQSFNKIIAWVAQMEENNGVSVDRASIDGVDAPGYVNAQIRLN